LELERNDNRVDEARLKKEISDLQEKVTDLGRNLNDLCYGQVWSLSKAFFKSMFVF
jgi:hypothetical protein